MKIYKVYVVYYVILIFFEFLNKCIIYQGFIYSGLRAQGPGLVYIAESKAP